MKLKSVIDENVRFRILRELVIGSGLPSRLEVFDDQVFSVHREGRENDICCVRHEITIPGMLYEILAMRSCGWLSRGRNRSSQGIHYWLTGYGNAAFYDLRERLRIVHVKEKLEQSNTHTLLGYLQQRWSSLPYDSEFWFPTTEIKAELAKRPHIESASERRKRLKKTEKGDLRRELAKR